MRAAVMAVVAAGLFGAAGAARAADDKELIVGTWELTYSDAKDAPIGAKIHFSDKRAASWTVKDASGKETTTDLGTYKVENGYLVLTGKDGKSDPGRICLLNKVSLVLNDEIEDKVMVLKRAKKK